MFATDRYLVGVGEWDVGVPLPGLQVPLRGILHVHAVVDGQLCTSCYLYQSPMDQYVPMRGTFIHVRVSAAETRKVI